jgi:tetratricopeptide (TPR) repeat protein
MPDVSLHPEIHAEVLAQVANHVFLQISSRDAKPYSEQALSIARPHQDKHNTARALVMLALALTDEKDFAAAQTALEESQTLFQEVQDEWWYGLSVQMSGWSAFRQENLSVALVWMEEALTILKKLGDQYFMSVILRGIGAVQIMQGDRAQGETALKEALVLAQKMDSKLEIAWNLSALGEAAQRANRWMRVVQLCWASRNILESTGAWQEFNDLTFEKDLARCRAALREAEFAAAESQGRLMTMEQAIAYALENDVS